MRQHLISLLYAAVFTGTAFLNLEAQEIYPFPVGDINIRQITDLYNKEMYRSSLEKIYSSRNEPKNTLTDDDLVFYEAMNALYNEQSNAEALLSEIINSAPRNIHYPETMFGYGKYMYSKGKYKEAADAFGNISASDIPSVERAEYYFKSGYSNYKSGKTDKAVDDFRKIKEQRNLYADAALYYYSHVEYEKGNYVTASQGFERLMTNPGYASVVPYYTLQIAFIQKNFDKVIADGEDFLSRSTESRASEIARLLAEAYIQKGNFEKSSEYFEKYEKFTPQLSREDYYLKGFIAYKKEDYSPAAKYFASAAANTKDSLSQLADYHLADCYMHTESGQDALTAFMRASQQDFNKAVQKDAFFNYAKLSLELQNNETPAVNFFAKYPDEINNPELLTYRAESEAKKGNYAGAIGILQTNRNISAAESDAIQRIAFAAGATLSKNKDYGNAIKMFDLAIANSSQGSDNSIKALSIYGKANAAYSMGNYGSARSLFQTFINTAGSFNLKEYSIAHYNIGYCYFKEQNYDQALTWFRKYISFEANTSRKTTYLGDCYNRIGDCYFKKREYQLAADNYTTSENLGISNPDYSALQRGISFGFTSGAEAKINALKHIPRSYPNSTRIPTAYYELGRTYQQQMKYDDAVAAFQSVVSKYRSSPVYSNSLVELGLIELNRGNYDKALSYYQQVVDKFPNSPEAQSAMEGIKNIYMEQNRMDEYINYSNRIGKGISNPEEKDSLIFVAAERLYQTGDCDRALPAMKKYLEEYPEGKFLTPAHFYQADCSMKQQDYAVALNGFGFVVRQPENDFTEAAWSGVARANYNLKNYTDAAAAFEQVKRIAQTPIGKFDAELGCMRSYVAGGNNEKAAASANVIVASTGISPELKREANLIIGRASQQAGDHSKAIKIFKTLAIDLNQPVDAEAKYRIIVSYFEMKRYKDSENEVLSFSDSESRQLYWVAKSFIVLGDIYLQRNNKVQAKATYESVVNGYKRQDDGVIDEARQKLNELE
ncbi:MAG: tetratricopeptide repeat protein [Prevotellaceae bacterium]|jgi:tetratricopeptide (TPR) repeat protein|nr:tetratricopeptide repeat protein [Prevotellaceae bacterium]